MAITVKRLHPLFCAEIGGIMTTAHPERYELAAE